LNVDYIVVGHALGAEHLGFYLLAFNISMWPSSLLSLAVRRVAIPGFSQLYGDPRALSQAYGRAFGGIASVGLLAAVVLGLMSTSVITVLYGQKWQPSAVALTWLALLGLFRVLIDVSYDLMVALRRSGRLLFLQLLWLGLLVPAMIVGVHMHGIAGAGAAHVLVAGLIILPMFLLTLRSVGVSIRPVVRAMVRPMAATVAAGAVVFAARSLPIPDLARLLTVGGLAALVFCLIAVPIRDVRQWRRQRRVAAA
jgi:PST family polysaccharide transporter